LLRPLDPGALIWYLGRLGLTLAELRPAEALACLAELQDLGDRLDEGSSAALATFAYLAVGYAKLGAQERSAACYPKLLPFRGWFAPLPADRALGLAARAAGNLDAARAHLAEAETRTRAAGMRPELALVLLERGLLERAAEGNRRSGARGGLGRELIAEGIGLCSELGMEELGRRTLSGAVTPERQDGARLHPAGLTNRELEVLRLVAQGRTNREIAETLFLSEHTVARHLTHIFTKAGVENRAGAAAFALRHELT
jgi:DNA-binding CsgD family transcriptional regulator